MVDVIEQFRLIRGTALVLDPVTLRDAAGLAVVGYDGTELLTCRVWPGAGLPTSFTPTVMWEDPAEALITITIEAIQTIGLASGRYRLVAKLDDGGRSVAAYEGVIILVPGPID